MEDAHSIAGCTDAIEEHHAVIATMGDRYIRVRVPDVDPREQGLKSQANRGQEEAMRSDLKMAVTQLFSGLDFSLSQPIEECDQRRINSLAVFVAQARSPVVRHGYTREIEYVPDAEKPARLSKSLLSLFAGAVRIGMCPEYAFQCISQVAWDCVPKVRSQLLKKLLVAQSSPTIGNLAEATRLPEVTVRRTIEDLKAHSLVESYMPAVGAPRDVVWEQSDGTNILQGVGMVWQFCEDAGLYISEAGLL